MEAVTETCENCYRTIGSLEVACVWQEHAVCAECHARLSGGPGIAPPEPQRGFLGKKGTTEHTVNVAVLVAVLIVFLVIPLAAGGC